MRQRLDGAPQAFCCRMLTPKKGALDASID
jgi:hypothetical protein